MYVIEYKTRHYNTIQCNAMSFNTIQYNTIQYDTIQYNIVEHRKMQYNIIQYNTIYFVNLCYCVLFDAKSSCLYRVELHQIILYLHVMLHNNIRNYIKVYFIQYNIL